MIPSKQDGGANVHTGGAGPVAWENDDAAITITTDRSKAISYAVILVSISVLIFIGPYGNKKLPDWEIYVARLFAVGLTGIGIFGIASAFFRPARLTLSRDGIVYSLMFRTFRYRWSDITDITYRKFWLGYAPSYWIVLSLRADRASRQKQFGAAPNEGIIEGRGWPMSAEELSKIVTSCRERWIPN